MRAAGHGPLEPRDLRLAASQLRRQVYPHVLAAEILRLVERANERIFLHNYPLTEPCVSPPTTIFFWNTMNSAMTGMSASMLAANTHSQRVAY